MVYVLVSINAAAVELGTRQPSQSYLSIHDTLTVFLDGGILSSGGGLGGTRKRSDMVRLILL